MKGKRLQVKQVIIAFFIAIFAFPALAYTPNDTFLGDQWYLEQIGAFEAWDSTAEAAQVIVAVLDAGFDLDHPDMQGSYWINEDEIANDGMDNDSNGFDDDVYGWDFIGGDPKPTPDISDDFSDSVVSHGTLVAGIIGAQTNNQSGIAGIVPKVRIMPIRVLDESGAGSSDVVRHGIEYAVKNGASVINLSFTALEPDPKLFGVIRWANEQGVVIVSSIGNGGINIDLSSVYPACFDRDQGTNYVIGVAATNRFDQKAEFSNYGRDCTDISAPGIDIFGLSYNDYTQLFFSTAYGGFWEGTSLSAPMVSAAAAVVRGQYPALTPEQIQTILKLSVDSLKEYSIDAVGTLGSGRVNIANALNIASQFAGITHRPQGTRGVTPSGSFVLAMGYGFAPEVLRVDVHGNTIGSFFAYDQAFTGGVRLAMGDVDGNGKEEIITAAGPGGGPQVRIFDVEGNVKNQFFAYDEYERYGIHVASGDINGDGSDEILVSSDSGHDGQVRIFNRFGHLLGAFYPFERTLECVKVTLANIDEDFEKEIVVSIETGSDSRVRLFEGTGLYVREIRAFYGSVSSGVSVAAGDFDQDGVDEIVVTAGIGYRPEVEIYSVLGQKLDTFLAYHPSFAGGVQVSVGDVDQDGRDEIFTTPLSGGGPHVRVFNGSGSPTGGFFAFEEEIRGTLNSATWNP